MKLTKSQRTQLEQASGLNKLVKFDYEDSGKVWVGRVVGEVSNYGGAYKNVLQKIVDEEDESKVHFRFGYYVFSAKAGRPMWIPQSLMVTKEQCQDLLEQARGLQWGI